MQLHPLAADTHERLLQSSQLTELGQPQRVIAQYCFPADVTQPVETDGTGGGPSLRTGPCLEP